MNIQTVSSSPSHFYYQCQDCLDSFICPVWQPITDGGKAANIAICPYCKSKQLAALDAALPLEIH